MKAFAQRDTLTVIDLVLPDGRSEYAKETLEQIQARYPGAELVDLDEFVAFKEAALCSRPEEITEERFMYYLEVLPPQNWQRGKGCESFELSEHLSGRVTQICVRIGSRFFGFSGIARSTLSDNLLAVKQVFGFNESAYGVNQ